MSDHDVLISESTEPQQRPTVVKWHIVYCLFEVVMDLAAVGVGVVVLMIYAPEVQDEQWSIIAYSGGIALIGAGLFGAALYGFGALVPRRPWAWVVGLVLIIFGMGSCTVVFCLPLVIYWFKPETKRWYGMKT